MGKVSSWGSQGETSFQLFRPNSMNCAVERTKEPDIRGGKPGQGTKSLSPSTVSSTFSKCASGLLSRVKAWVRNLISSTTLIRRNIV